MADRIRVYACVRVCLSVCHRRQNQVMGCTRILSTQVVLSGARVLATRELAANSETRRRGMIPHGVVHLSPLWCSLWPDQARWRAGYIDYFDDCSVKTVHDMGVR